MVVASLGKMGALAKSVDATAAVETLAAISDECNFHDYDELIVSTLPLKISKWLHVDLPRKAGAATGLPVTHVVGSEA